METRNWTGVEVRQKFADCESLKDLIDAMEKDFERVGRVICQIKINDLLFSETDELKFAGTGIDEIKTLEIATDSMDSLVESSMKSVKSMIPQMREAALLIAEELRTNWGPETQFALTDLIETSQWLTEALKHLKLFVIEASDSPLAAELWQKNEREFSKVVQEVLTAFEKQDMVRMGDAIEYDLTNVLDKWLEVLKSQASIEVGA